jgi:hypothetical protein
LSSFFDTFRTFCVHFLFNTLNSAGITAIKAGAFYTLRLFYFQKGFINGIL